MRYARSRRITPMAMHSGRNSTPRSRRGSIATLRLTRLALIVTLALTVCSCGMTPIKAPPPSLQQPQQPVQKPDPSLLMPCPDLPLASSGKSDALMRNHLQITGSYHDCQASKADLVRWIQKHLQQETEQLRQGSASSSKPIKH